MSFSPATSAKTFWLTLSVVAFLLPQVEAGLTTRLVLQMSANFVCQERPASSYQTDLWDMEFQERADNNKEIEQFAEGEDGEASVSVGGAKSGVRSPGYEPGSENWGSIPGQVYLHDMTEETPFAEWQVDRSASDRSQHFSGGPTAWVMSRVRAKSSQFNTEQPKADGPSLFTLLVAIIACMVMAGALFAER